MEYLGGARLFVGAIGIAIVVFLLVLLGNQMIAPPIDNLRDAMQAVVMAITPIKLQRTTVRMKSVN